MSDWMERAQSAEAVVGTLKEANRSILDKFKEFKSNFGVKERGNGDIEVDFEQFVQNIGVDSALELKQIIEQVYGSKKES